jgi:hypothetical protein
MERKKRKIRAEIERETRCFFRGDFSIASWLKNCFKNIKIFEK